MAEVAVLLEEEEKNSHHPVWNVKRVSWGHVIHLPSFFLIFAFAFTEGFSRLQAIDDSSEKEMLGPTGKVVQIGVG